MSDYPGPMDILIAANVLEILAQQAEAQNPVNYFFSPHTLREKAREMREKAEANRRKRDRVFQLASDIRLAQAQSGCSEYTLAEYVLAHALVEQGWDKRTTEGADDE